MHAASTSRSALIRGPLVVRFADAFADHPRTRSSQETRHVDQGPVSLVQERKIRYVMVDGIAHVPEEAVEELRARDTSGTCRSRHFGVSPRWYFGRGSLPRRLWIPREPVRPCGFRGSHRRIRWRCAPTHNVSAAPEEVVGHAAGARDHLEVEAVGQLLGRGPEPFPPPEFDR